MSHDAVTGEIDLSKDFGLETALAQTQDATLVGQLDCGARSFDYRPYLDSDGTLYAAHGIDVVHKPMKDSIDEVSNWCDRHSNNLVIFYLSHFAGESESKDRTLDLLSSKGIFTVTNCDDLSTLTVGEAKSKSQLPGGGNLMALVECVEENWDPSILCYGTNPSTVCYDSWPKNTSGLPWAALSSYLTSTVSTPPSQGMWMLQGHWQSSASSDSQCVLHNSSLLLDEQRSGLNLYLAAQVQAGAFPRLNILEVDNVCDGGSVLYSAIQAQYTQYL